MNESIDEFGNYRVSEVSASEDRNEIATGTLNTGGSEDVAGVPKNRATDLEVMHDLERELRVAKARLALLESLITIDPITDVLNQQGLISTFEKRLGLVDRHAENIAIVTLRVSGPDIQADRRGAFVQRAIRIIANRLRTFIRIEDDVAHLNDLTFVLVLHHCDLDQAKKKAVAVQKSIRAVIFDLGGNAAPEVHIGVSKLDPKVGWRGSLAAARHSIYPDGSIPDGPLTPH